MTCESGGTAFVTRKPLSKSGSGGLQQSGKHQGQGVYELRTPTLVFL